MKSMAVILKSPRKSSGCRRITKSANEKARTTVHKIEPEMRSDKMKCV